MEKRSLPPSPDFLQNDGAFSSIFHWLRCFPSPSPSPSPPDFYVLLLIASINLKSLDRDRCNCQAQCHRSRPPLPVVIYSACISAVVTYSAYISGDRDYVDRSRLSSPIRSLARSSFIKEIARNERRKKKYFPPASPFSWSLRDFSVVSLLPVQRFACPWHGRTFNFNHRPGNYKSCSHSRTLSIKDFRFSRDDRSGWQGRETEK